MGISIKPTQTRMAQERPSPKSSHMMTAKKLGMLLSMLLLASVTFAQINGQVNPGPGQTENYTYNDGSVYIVPNWAITNGSVISSSVNGTLYSATVQWGSAGPGSLSFKAKTTVISTLSVTVTCNITFYTVGGGGSYCSGGSGVLVSLNSSQTGVNYALYLNGANTGSTIAGNGVHLSWADRTAPGTYTVMATNTTTGCSVLMNGSTSITVNTVPTVAISTNQSICSGQTALFTISNPNGVSGTTFGWTQSSSNVTGASNGSGATISQVLTSTNGTSQGTVTYTATATANGCNGTPINATAFVNPVPQVSNLPASTSICSGTALNFTPAASIGGTTLTWTSSISGTINAGSVTASGSGAITNSPQNTGNTSGTVTYAVTPSLNGCSGNTQNYTVTVNPIPTVAISSGPSICSGVVASLTLSNPNGVSGTTISWTQAASNVTGASNGTGTSISQTLTSTNGTAQGTVVYTATASANGCNSTTAVSTATVKPIPQITNTAPQLLAEVCSPSTPLNFTPSSSVGGTTFAWTSSATAGIFGNSPTGIGTISNILGNSSSTTAGSATYVITPSLNGCSGTLKNYVVTVVPKPLIAQTGSATLVYGTVTQLSTTATAAVYNWKLNSTNISGATVSSYRVGQIGTYTIGIKNTVSSTTECISTGTVVSTAVQSAPVNFVSTTRILKEGVAATASLYALNPEDLVQTVAYQDGIGRTFQTVGVGMSAQQTDLVNPIAYGKQSLVDTTFLPYATTAKDGRFKLNAIRTASGNYTGSEQQYFYQNEVLTAHDAQPFARTVNRTAPDARVTEQGAPGADWQPGNHTVKNTVTINTPAYPVRYWKTDGTTNTNYPDKTVVVNITTDENGNKVRTYTNKFGQTVLKQVELSEAIGGGPVVSWLETYYVYDVFGRLIYQLPPKAMSILTGVSLNANNVNVAELIYKYTYDAKGRLVEKKVPGAASEYIVYDKLDRVVLTQDGNLRATNDWMFVKYDYRNRPVFIGLYKNTVQLTRATVQNEIDLNYSGAFEGEQINAANHGYSNATFPITNNTTPVTPLTVLSVNYYDHYNFDRQGAYDYKYDSLHLTGIPTTRNKIIRGLPTGSKKVIIDATGAITSNWLISVVFYDKFERPVQTLSNNHLNLAVQDKASVLYDFVRATKSKTTHVAPTTVNIVRRYTFDHVGRTLGVYQTIDNLPEQQVAAFQYNKLGQLVDKKLHNTGGSTFLQSIDYRYNIRGWLSSINNSQLLNDGITNDETNDFFGMELNYNTSAGIGNTSHYNGNISAIKWKGPGLGSGAADQRSYKYEYDKSDKLETATFQAHNGTAWTKEANTLNESLGYDHNGNILSLSRSQDLRGRTGLTITSTPQTIDNLTYTYASANQNQLNKVEDAALSTGFNNGVNTATEYTYSPDGSLAKDDNKGISTIVYNALGKPRQITFTDGRIVAYTYATDGSKLKMAVTVNSVTTTTDYVGGFIYTNNALSFFGSPEGRVVKSGSTYEYQYAIGDHQGNTRVVFSSVTPAPTAPQATWEGDANDNASQYSNIVAGNVVSFTAANHTPSGTKVLRMNQTNKIQATKSLAVYPGDKVDLEVWEYHEGNSGFGTTSTPINTLITNVAGAFGGVSGAPDPSGSIYNGVNSAITNIGTGGNQGSTRPAAYLNYILFDKNYKVMNAGWQLAPAATFTKQKLSFTTIDVKEAGFIFVWLSYDDDSNNWVYFDDLKVTHTKNNIIQYNEYYPFGLQTATSWTRENNTGNNFLANGATELNSTSSLYDLEYRNYDPVLGRMHQVDPMAAKYSSLTPYNFSFNDPVAFTDRNGADPMPGEPDHVRQDIGSRYLGKAVNRYFGSAIFSGTLGHITPGSGGHWSDGIGFSDWSLYGGSQMYQDGLAAGYTDLGGNLYRMNADGTRDRYGEKNGQTGHWVDKALTGFYFSGGQWKPYGGLETKFVPDSNQDGYGNTWQERTSNPEMWKDLGLMFLGLKENPQSTKVLKCEMPYLATLASPGGAIGIYSKLAQTTKGWRGLIQAHHIVEVRHLKALGLSILEAPSVILSKAKHLEVTKAIRDLLPYGRPYTKAEIMAAYKQAYSAYPEWIKQAATYLGL